MRPGVRLVAGQQLQRMAQGGRESLGGLAHADGVAWEVDDERPPADPGRLGGDVVPTFESVRLTVDPDAMQANMDATKGAVLAERATFLLAETMGKQKAGKLVEEALAKGGSFIEALGQLEKELSDEAALLGYSPKFVDRLLADLKRK